MYRYGYNETTMTEKEKLISAIRGSCITFSCNYCPITHEKCTKLRNESLNDYKILTLKSSLPDEIRNAAYDKFVELYSEEDLMEELL